MEDAMFNRCQLSSLLTALALVAAACGGDAASADMSTSTTGGTATSEAASTTGPTTATTTARSTTTTTTRLTTTTTLPRLTPTWSSSYATGVAAYDGEVWVALQDLSRIYWLIYPESEATEIADVCNAPMDLAIDAARVWVRCGIEIVVIDRSAREVVSTIDLDGPSYSLALGDGAAWVVGEEPEPVMWVIDSSRLAVVDTIPLPHACDWPQQVIVAGDLIWVVVLEVDSCPPGFLTYERTRIDIIDPHQSSVVQSIPISGVGVSLAYSDGEVWAAGLSEGILTVMDPTGAPLGAVNPHLGRSRHPMLAASHGYVWVITPESGNEPAELIIIDRLGRRVLERIGLSGPTDIAADGDVAWVTHAEGLALVASDS